MRAASLFGVLLLAKILALAGRDIPLSAWSVPAYLWQDLICALAFAAFDYTLRRPWIVWTGYGAIAAYAAVNVPITRELSTPLTWPLLRAARGPLSDSIAHHVTPENVLLICTVLVAASVFPLLLRRLPARALVMASVAALPVVLLGPLGTSRVETRGLHRNALAALVTTAFPRIPAQDAACDWRASLYDAGSEDDLSPYRGAAANYNVVLLILESAAAQYLKPYGAATDPMPRLTKLTERAILFENAYAVYPESIKGLYSIICSIEPAFGTTPEEYEPVPCVSLAEALGRAGYRTGLFHSGRFVYLGMESIVRRRGYQTLEDAGNIGGEYESSFGIDEPSTVERILSWIDESSPDRRFFVTYLPIAGHHPYESPEAGPFPVTEDVHRYLNALHYADAALGRLLDGLRARGLERNTVLVIVGDHGEAFGQHEGNYGHTLSIYEENVHVPYVIVAPGLIGDQVRVRRIASLVDTAPTVLSLLGLDLPAEYQGRSLLDGRPSMALFFTDYSLGLVGLRDGCWKIIDELDADQSELYNLCSDPHEKVNLASQFHERVKVYREHARRWIAARRGFVQGYGKPLEPGTCQ
jgi:arylsulfatase A-like enzyme